MDGQTWNEAAENQEFYLPISKSHQNNPIRRSFSERANNANRTSSLLPLLLFYRQKSLYSVTCFVLVCEIEP